MLFSLEFEWKKGSLNDNGFRLLREHFLEMYYDHFGQPVIYLGKDIHHVNYERIDGDLWKLIVE